MAEAKRRDGILTALAILIGLMAVSNLLKPVGQAFDPEGSAGFVFFGQRLHGMANTIVGPLFGVFHGVYAWAVWNRRRFVVPMALAYAAYVPLNLVLFALDPPPNSGGALFGAIYAIIAIGVSGGGAFYLYSRRDTLH